MNSLREMVRRALVANGFGSDTQRINLNAAPARWDWTNTYRLVIAFNTNFNITHVINGGSEQELHYEFADGHINYILVIDEDDKTYFNMYRIESRNVFLANIEVKETQRWDVYENSKVTKVELDQPLVSPF